MPATKKKTAEVIGVVDADGAGGGMGHGRLWLFGVQFSHWRIADGDIETTPLHVQQVGTEKDLDEWRRSIKPRNMLRMKVQFTRSVVKEQKRAKIIEYLGKDNSDKELRRAAKDKRPAKIEVPYFKSLRLEPDARRYSALTKWRRKPIELSFDFDDSKRILRLCPKVESLVKSSAKLDDAFRAMVSDHLYEDWVDEWRSDEESKLTRKQFEKRLIPRELVVEEDGGFVFVYDDDDLFQGHELAVYGTLSKGAKRADLVG